MKIKAIILACMIMISGLFVGTLAQAAPFTGTIVLTDNSYNVQNYFEPYENVYFEATVLDDGGPLQYETVRVIITNSTGVEVFNSSYSTSIYGEIDGIWYGGVTGTYLVHVTYNSEVIANTTFEVYVPVPWSADCWTTQSDDTVTDNFTESEWVYLQFQVFDQKGNPYDTDYSWDVYFEITHNENQVDSGYLYTNSEGEASDNYYPSGSAQFGSYLVTVFNDVDDAIGTHIFNVILPDTATIELSYYGEERTVFREGEVVGYTIYLFHHTSIPYDSGSQAARVLLYKEGEAEPLENNTLNTDSDGIDYETSFFYVNYGESYKGTYYVRVYNQTWNIIGTATFLVIDINIELLPEKDVYSQGDTVTITVTTTLEEPYRVRISDDSGTQVPTATWNVPAGTEEWWKDFTFPETLPDGWYSVDVFMDSLLLTSRYFELKKITLQLELSQTAFVPGQSGTAFWRAVNNHDGGAITVTGDSIMHYVDDEFDTINKDLADISGASGSFSFTVPKDALLMTTGDIEVEARDTASHSDTGTEGFQVRGLGIQTDTDRGSYMPGDTIFLTIDSVVSGTNFPVPSVDVKLTMQRDGTMVGSSWTVRTNSAGSVSTTYQIPGTAAKGIWVLVINATFDANNNIKYNGTRGITLNTDPVVSLELQQLKSLYTPGEAITVPYRVLRGGANVTNAKVIYNAYITQSGATITVSLGFGSNNNITFTLPNNVEGTLTVQAAATFSDGLQAFDSLNNIPISSGQIVLFSLKSTYLPGEIVTWTYTLSSDTEISAMYRITGPDGLVLAQGTPENGTITYQLPADNAVNPTARIYVIGSRGTYFATNTAQVFQGYYIEYRVLSNSYSPGDIMKINYTIRKIGEVPENVGGFQLQINIAGEHTKTVWVTEIFGILEYEISEDIEDGRHIVSVVLAGSAGFNDVQAVIIDSNAGELAHGTILGMNASGFLALVFAIIALIIAIIGVMKWRAMAKSGAAAPPAPPMEPAPPVDAAPPMQPVESYPPPPETAPEASYQYPPPPQE